MKNFLMVLRVLGEATRLRIFLLLRDEEISVAELQEIFGMGQSRISSHLSQLKKCGLISDRRLGKSIFYRAVEPVPETIDVVLDEAARNLPEASQDAAALRLVLGKRHDRAMEYFNRLAGKFGRTYIPGRTWRGLSHALLRLLPPMDIADVGAGEGTLSQLLARTARKVIAVDNSAEMVAYGARIAAENGINNLEYRQGDVESLPLADAAVDLVLLSQVLHHVASPARALREARRISRPGGRVMILDLASHSFEQARELYAHVWLGFSEVELHELLRKAGFENIEVGVVSTETQPPYFRTILATGHAGK
jgi:ubiquinone/menaquinone biosynthesis C-methylase UbiE/DNA-binding transcriptional ArsR family regulator